MNTNYYIVDQENDKYGDESITVALLENGKVAYELWEDDAKALNINSEPYRLCMWPESQNCMDDENAMLIIGFPYEEDEEYEGMMYLIPSEK